MSSVVSELEKLPEETRRVLDAKIELSRREMHELNDQTRRHVLVRDEEVIGRLATIQEGQQRRRRRKET